MLSGLNEEVVKCIPQQLRQLSTANFYKSLSGTPTLRQIVWGDNERQATVSIEDVSCTGVAGCRLNACMQRRRPVPIGCPVDELEPVGTRHLVDFEWFWVDVYGQNEDGWQGAPELRRLYDGPHLYPWRPCCF